MFFMQSFFPDSQFQVCTTVWSYSGSDATMHLYLLSSVIFLLACSSRLSPAWHFNVTHKLAEDGFYPTFQIANDDFK